MTPPQRLRVARVTVVVHAAAVLLTLAALLPGLPPNDPAARRAFVAAHGTAWLIGWLAWMLATATWVLFVRAWLETLPRAGSVGTVAFGLTLAGALLDWAGDVAWAGGWDDALAMRVMGLANVPYALGGALLTGLSLRTPAFPRWLAAWSALAWAAALGLAVAALAGDGRLVNLASTVLFATFVPWLAFMGAGWLAGRHPSDPAVAAPGRLTLREVARAIVPKHPLPMRTVFLECALVNFAVRPEVMRRLVPGPIEPDLHRGEAFLSIVIARMERMRPTFVPAALGVSYHQVVYRAVVRCGGERGVYFLRSDADNRWMALAGDWLTFFGFHHARIAVRREGALAHVDLAAGPGAHADIRATYHLAAATDAMPAGSRFAKLAEAQAFLVDRFAAFGYDALTGEVLTVRIERGAWDLRVVEDRRAGYDFMDGSPLFPAGSARLDSIFWVERIPYRWHRLAPRDRRVASR